MRTLALFLIGVTFGGAGGFVYAAANGITLDGHDHSDPAHHGGMQHGDGDHAMLHDTPRDVDPASAPTLAVEVTADPMAGYNLHVMAERFRYAPRAASGPHVAGEGHAHVYANGVKLGRLYGPWMHLENLPKGEVEITVTLNANDHRPLAIAGAPIAASTTVTVD
ncbi:hypothetical protein KDD17_15750 [Sulfitobacter albidus]|uniref:Copper chaperone PCu(A)C n=1 Tax=Sulfitobacter albidus TaxID=2829501 RepID=A0A975JD99_9RHOB|nr:hypothetical protein [Sulfitobacter albidus]QUJ76328.1 hypothetical protein KDD17_15750 [Sulfitobacter albidus]